MIGFYDYTVVLTYMSLASSTIGMMFALNGHFRLAITCLCISGLLDMFDGKVARTKKNRTDDEKMFGIQIDSLCDAVCFGFFPGIICYSIGLRGYLADTVIIFYAIAAVIRLGFFNVLEMNRQQTEGGSNKFYYGLPVTSIAIILPIVFLLNFVLAPNVFYWVLLLSMLTTGILFILNFKLKKPNNKQLFLIVSLVAIVLAITWFYKQYMVAHPPLIENLLIER